MNLLGEKLGPLLVRLLYSNRQAFRGLDEFLAKLVPFLDALPCSHRFAVGIRYRAWLADHSPGLAAQRRPNDPL